MGEVQRDRRLDEGVSHFKRKLIDPLGHHYIEAIIIPWLFALHKGIIMLTDRVGMAVESPGRRLIPFSIAAIFSFEPYQFYSFAAGPDLMGCGLG